MNQYAKAIVALAALLAVVGKVLSDGHVAPDEIGQLVIAASAVVGVFYVPNKPKAASSPPAPPAKP